MTIEENLRAGIAAAKAGDRATAASFFAKVVKEDPNSEQGWFLLGSSLSDGEKREFCFRRVLAINPYNSQARRKLDSLTKPPSPSGSSFSPSSSLGEELAKAPSSGSTAPKQDETAAPATPPVQADGHLHKKGTTPQPADSAVRSEEGKKERPDAPSQKKSSNRAIFIITFITSVCILCGMGVGFLQLTGQLDQLSSFSIAEVNDPEYSAPVNTFTPLGPTATPTSTPDPSILPTPKPSIAYTPIFEEASCPFTLLALVDVRCGYIVVPEDRTGDPNHTIRLAVAIYESHSENPRPDPVVFLQGGPGAEALQLTADAFYGLVEPFLSQRDFLVIDQRGTGFSEPSLECEELTKTYLQDINGLIDISTRELVYANSFRSCEGLMRAEGINPNAYTTLESATDVRDMLSLLGYQKANMYGVSYGTRLAQVIMREYPEIVESTILDSVVPVDANLFGRYPEAIESGLSTLFAACANDTQCNSAYPDLEATFWDLVTELDVHPITITTSNYPNGTITETVTGTTVMNIILGSIKNSNFISTAPQSIYRFKEGDFSTLALAQSNLPFAFEGISPGLFISMMCHEHILTTTAEQLRNASGRKIIKEFAWLPFYGDAENIFNTCESWGATGPVVGENDPAISDLPSLIMTGAYDPTTPPNYGLEITGNLSNHHYFEFSYHGHTPSVADATGCAMDIVIDFLDSPHTDPNRKCLDEIDPVEFVVPYTGDPPVKLENIDAYGLSLDAPRDWISLEEGFYFRGNSPLDLTQVGILRVPVNPEEIKELFSLPAYGFGGLDSALIPAGQRNANGFSWELLTSSSYGRPVDIAIVNDRGWSIVILLLSNQDEHEALYNTVFLEMIDSTNR